MPFTTRSASEAQSDRPGRPRHQESGLPERSSLQRYLKDLPPRRVLEREEELDLARAISGARRDLAGLFRSLPEPWRSAALDAGLRKIKRHADWPLDRLEDSVRRLLALEEQAAAGDLDRIKAAARSLWERLSQAREELIVSNLPLVIHMARSACHLGVPFPDLIQEGNIGLMRAVEKYDWERGFRFSTYAVWWIRSGLSRALLRRSRLVRLPFRQREQIIAMKRTMAAFGQQNGRQPRMEELAEIMDLPEERIMELQASAHDTVPLEEPEDEEGRIGGPILTLAAPEDLDPLRLTLQGQLRERLARAMGCLRPKERRVLELRYGLEDGHGRTLKEIAAVMGLSRERIRQIEAFGLEKLRARHEDLSELLEQGAAPGRRSVSRRTRSVTPGHAAWRRSNRQMGEIGSC